MKKIFLIIPILFILTSFSENKQTNFQGLIYTFKKGNRTMKLEFETNNKYLELNKTTTLKISLTNISTDNFSIYGAGIKMSGGGKNFIKCKISPIEKYLVNNNFEVSLFEKRNEKNELFHKLLIPIKIN